MQATDLPLPLCGFFPSSLESCDPNVQGGRLEQLSSVPHPPDHSPTQQEGKTLSNTQEHSPSQQEGQTLSIVQDPSPSRPPLPRTQSQFATALEEKESLLRQQETTISEQLR